MLMVEANMTDKEMVEAIAKGVAEIMAKDMGARVTVPVTVGDLMQELYALDPRTIVWISPDGKHVFKAQKIQHKENFGCQYDGVVIS